MILNQIFQPSFTLNIITNLLDVLIVSVIIYFVLIFFKESSSRFIFGGILLAVVIYLLAVIFDLRLTSLVFGTFFSVFLIALIIIFQEEIRRFFKFVFIGWFTRQEKISEEISQEIVGAVEYLIKKRIGALIVLEGKEPLEDFIKGGFHLNGRVSEQILESIFDPHTPGHDGAVLIDNNRIKKFGAQLPLSEHFEKIKKFGTRHSAALGLAERTDALIIVVSEERGAISIARAGDLKPISDINELTNVIADFYNQGVKKNEISFRRRLWQKNFKEKVFAIVLALILWLILVFKQ